MGIHPVEDSCGGEQAAGGVQGEFIRVHCGGLCDHGRCGLCFVPRCLLMSAVPFHTCAKAFLDELALKSARLTLR